MLFLTGLGQVQLKLGEIKNALSNFEKVLEVYPDNCETLKVSGLVAFFFSFSNSLSFLQLFWGLYASNYYFSLILPFQLYRSFQFYGNFMVTVIF
jgi:predicted transcriptional regulator